MQTAELGHDVSPAQPQVEGIAENDLGVDFLQFQRRHGLYRTIGADRHEDRGLALHRGSVSRGRGGFGQPLSVLSSLNSSMVLLYLHALGGQQHGIAIAEEAVFIAIAWA
jgi:hypothetical protein